MMETMEARSFASRRPAATSLPAFTLPPPDIPSTRYPPAAAASDASSPHHASAAFGSALSSGQGPSRHSPLQHHHLNQRPRSASSSNTAATPAGSSSLALPRPAPTQNQQGSSVLTPSSGVASDGLSPSSGIHTGSSQNSQPGGGAGGSSMYYQAGMGGSWPAGTPGSTSSAYTFTNQGLGSNPSGPPSGLMPSYPPHRSLYGNASPHLPQFGSRASHSPAHGENLPPPSSYQGQSPFPTGLGGGPALPPTIPSQGHHAGAPVTTHPVPQSILSSQGPPVVSHPSASPGGGPPPLNSQHPLPSPNSSYYPRSSTPQTGSFPSFTTGPPPQGSLTGGPLPATSASSLRGLTTAAGQSGMAPPMGYGARSHYNQGYNPLPSGPVLANLHSPGAPLTIVGGPMMGYPQGHPGHGPFPPQLYGAGPHGHPPPHQGTGSSADRPFKCDTCPQSFNRNHDLKRHKRIHLAVKPYPCAHCDKSFSRKDALKRHRLVKGCGKKADMDPTLTPGAQPEIGTPPDRSDCVSEGTEGSPNVKLEK